MVDQHAGGKWLIHDTKRRKDNQLQSLKLPCRIYSLVGHDISTAARIHVGIQRLPSITTLIAKFKGPMLAP